MISYKKYVIVIPVTAVVVELADTQDLGSCAVRREGSSPSNRMYAGSFLLAENGAACLQDVVQLPEEKR